jgi:hypothetical protein
VSQVDALWRAILPGRWRSLYAGLLAALGLGLALLGARQLIPILNPVTLLFREADRPAMSWIRENLPEDGTVLINPFAWGYGLYAGNDGGAWISPLTGRKTVPPPVLYGFGDPASIQQINAISQQAIEKSADPVELHASLKTWGIPYLYVGRRGGVFSPQRLQGSGLFETLYARDGVWIFRALDGG